MSGPSAKFLAAIQFGVISKSAQFQRIRELMQRGTMPGVKIHNPAVDDVASIEAGLL
jgi:hypothetical protein